MERWSRQRRKWPSGYCDGVVALRTLVAWSLEELKMEKNPKQGAFRVDGGLIQIHIGGFVGDTL